MEFVDIHGHYAWGIDDGIRNLDEARVALQNASKVGVRVIAATPHVISGTHFEKDIQCFKERISELKKEASQVGIEVHEGSELFLNHDAPTSIRNGYFIPYENTKYALCEFDVRRNLPDDEDEVEEYLYSFKSHGYTPVVAHVERYFKKGIDIDRVSEWVDMGYIIQVNASSLIGTHGSTVLKNAEALIENNLAMLVASDTHKSEERRSPATLVDAYAFISKKYGEDTAHILMHDNPLHILHNKPIVRTQVKKPSFFKKLFGR